MADASSRDFVDIDWSRLPPPVDDGSAKHLPGTAVPDIPLASTGGSAVSLVRLAGRCFMPIR
jgi:hypothetical protein